MKIAIVLNSSWNIYNFRMNLVKSFIHKNYKVNTIAPCDRWTHLLTREGCIHHHVKLDSRGVNPIKDVLLFVALFFIYRKIRPDVILHFTIKPNIYGTIAARILSIPTINNVCGLGTIFLKKNLISYIGSQLYKLAFRYPKKVFFQNVDDSQVFSSTKLISPRISEIIPGSGIDLTKFQPQRFSRNRVFTFLMIARLIMDKGILEFIAAIRFIKSLGHTAKFQILGPHESNLKFGIDLNTLRGWIKEGMVDYLGTTDNVQFYINEADCIVLPSYREGMPRVLLEAASCAKPIVATNVPGCRQVVQDNYNGYLCQAKDWVSLAECMIKMMYSDNNTLKSFGENGRRKMENEFCESKVTQHYSLAIDEILTPRNL